MAKNTLSKYVPDRICAATAPSQAVEICNPTTTSEHAVDIIWKKEVIISAPNEVHQIVNMLWTTVMGCLPPQTLKLTIDFSKKSIIFMNYLVVQ